MSNNFRHCAYRSRWFPPLFLAVSLTFVAALVLWAQLPSCNDRYPVIYNATYCGGHWCEDYACDDCPECISRCSCDTVLCDCFGDWMGVYSCWTENCDGSGGASLPGQSKFAALASAARNRSVARLLFKAKCGGRWRIDR